MKPAGPPFPLVEAIAVALAWVAYADEVLEPKEAEAITDAVASLVEGPSPGELARRVRACLVDGKKPLLVGRACLTLAVQPLALRVATLRSAWLVARAHERASDVERRRVEQLARDLGVEDDELRRATT